MLEALTSEVKDHIHTKEVCETVLTVENCDLKWFHDPNYLSSRYLDPKVFYPLEGHNNFRGFYEQILIETNSILFDHSQKGDTRNNRMIPYSFSKAYINKVLTQSEWGLDPNRPRNMISYPKMDYNYWDYKKAWYNAFYYQNPQWKHTWFFKFSPDFGKTEIPNWLIHWWSMFGAEPVILPLEIFNKFVEYQDFHPTLRNKTQVIPGLAAFKFFVNYNLPWIWKWVFNVRYEPNFNCGLPTLIREFEIKWWSKWNSEEILEKINKDIDHYKDLVAREEQSSEEEQDDINPLDLLKTDLRKKFPNLTPVEINKKVIKILAKELMKDNIKEDDILSEKSETQKSQKSVMIEDSEDEELSKIINNDDLDQDSQVNVWDKITAHILQSDKKKQKATTDKGKDKV